MNSLLLIQGKPLNQSKPKGLNEESKKKNMATATQVGTFDSLLAAMTMVQPQSMTIYHATKDGKQHSALKHVLMKSASELPKQVPLAKGNVKQFAGSGLLSVVSNVRLMIKKGLQDVGASREIGLSEFGNPSSPVTLHSSSQDLVARREQSSIAQAKPEAPHSLAALLASALSTRPVISHPNGQGMTSERVNTKLISKPSLAVDLKQYDTSTAHELAVRQLFRHSTAPDAANHVEAVSSVPSNAINFMYFGASSLSIHAKSAVHQMGKASTNTSLNQTNVLSLIDSNVHRIFGKMVVQHSGSSELRVHIHPEGLGDILISVSKQGTGLHIHVTATQVQSVQWFQRESGALSQAIQNAGIEVNGLQVSLGQTQVSDQGHQQSQQQSEANQAQLAVINKVRVETSIPENSRTISDYHPMNRIINLHA